MNTYIQEIKVTPLKAPLLQPFRIATGQHDSLDNLLVTLHLANGIVGYGEAAVATHITGETIAQTKVSLSIASQYLKDKQPSDYLRISAWLHDSFPKNMAAVAAIETALLDALAQSFKIPLWKMFGSPPQALKTDITIVIASLEETQAKTREFYRKGFRSFKIKIGKDMDLDLKRVISVSQLARSSKIILDANQGYDSTEALKFLKSLDQAKVKVDLLEQPVPKGDREGLKRLTRLSKVPICADESASSIADALKLINEEAVDAINIKLMKTGLIHSLQIARLAHAKGIKLMIGGMMESNIAMTAAAHLAVGFGCFDFVDLDTPFFIKGEVKRNPYLSESGLYDLKKVRCGIGIKVKN